MKTKTFQGGYRFRNFYKGKGSGLTIPKAPSRVNIPLIQSFGASINPIVSPGDKVSCGDIIARNDQNISSPVHASISGTVKDIKKISLAGREVQVVSIEGDGRDGFTPIKGCSKDWQKLSKETIDGLLYTSGVSGLDNDGIPTLFNSSIISPGEVKDIIVHWVEVEPYDLPLDILVAGENLSKFTEGVKILNKIMPEAKIHIALNREKKSLIKNTAKFLKETGNAAICPLIPKFPQNHDEVLVSTVLNRKFPYGYSAANLGVIVLTAQTVIHAYEAVCDGKPLIDRIIAVSGPALKDTSYIKVRIGAILEDVLKEKVNSSSTRLILNSIITGEKIDTLSCSVDKRYSQIIAVPEGSERKFMAFLEPGFHTDSYSKSFLSSIFPLKKNVTTNLHGEERPCIQCGYCLEVCPVKIMPAFIDRKIKEGVNEALVQYDVFNCIDCNLCTYVCPSKIPLAKNIKKAKDSLSKMGEDESKYILPKFNLIGLGAAKGDR